MYFGDVLYNFEKGLYNSYYTFAYPFPHVSRGVMVVQPRWGCFYKENCIKNPERV